MIPSAVREEVRARTDLADLVGQYVPLRRAGQSLIARCPFHEEKTPSFHVSRDRGLFYCFGCKASGDVFSFYERIEGVSFPDALRALAARAGIEIVEEVKDPARVAEEKRSKELTERLYHACEVAAAFYEEQLNAPDDELAALARDEIAARGVGPEVAAQFRLGYAPATWDALAEHLKKHSVSPSDAEIAGLLMPGKKSGHYDRFRHRLVFPIWDRNGKIVAFSCRILPVTEAIPEGIVPADAGKYINSPETPIYKKSELLFGLQVARVAMRQRAEAIVVEGNFDVVTMHQHGFAETVAPLGTSFTDAQARLLRRLAESVALVFDGDSAGRKAARAAQPVCARAGLIARVVVLPKGKDPDEVLREPNGREFLADRVKHAPSIVEWMISDVASECGDNTPERVAALRTLAPVLAQVADSLEREVYIQQAARSLHFEIRHVQQAMREAEKAAKAVQHNPFHGRAGGGAPVPPPRVERDEPFRKPAASEPVTASGDSVGTKGAAPGARKPDATALATAEAINALLRTPSLLGSETVDALLPLLDPSFAQPLVTEARRQWLARGELDGPALLAIAPHDKARAWIGERIIPVGDGESTQDEANKKALAESVARLKALRDRESAKSLEHESERARMAGDEARAAQLSYQAQLIKQRLAAAQKNRGAE